jgi:hypothetical protein
MGGVSAQLTTGNQVLSSGDSERGGEEATTAHVEDVKVTPIGRFKQGCAGIPSVDVRQP